MVPLESNRPLRFLLLFDLVVFLGFFVVVVFFTATSCLVPLLVATSPPSSAAASSSSLSSSPVITAMEEEVVLVLLRTLERFTPFEPWPLSRWSPLLLLCPWWRW
jgi:hypothetical protein